MQAVGDGAIVIVPAAPERIRSRIPITRIARIRILVPHRLRRTGGGAGAGAGRRHGESLLFCRERDPEREGWDGPRLGPEGAVDLLGMDDAYPIADIDDILPACWRGGGGCITTWVATPTSTQADRLDQPRARAGAPGRAAAAGVLELGHLLTKCGW